jgi:hypothetical protein
MLIPALQSLEPNVRTAVQSELGQGERLVWASPAVPRFFTGTSIGAVVFAIPWTGFAIFWMAAAFYGTGKLSGANHVRSQFDYVFPLFGVPFVLIGLALLSSPYWTARRLRRTVYVITDTRAIVLAPGWFGATKVQTFAPDALASMERVERRDGSGDLIFEQYTQRRGSSTQTIRRGFMSVPKVREVEELVRATLLQGVTRAA